MEEAKERFLFMEDFKGLFKRNYLKSLKNIHISEDELDLFYY